MKYPEAIFYAYNGKIRYLFKILDRFLFKINVSIRVIYYVFFNLIYIAINKIILLSHNICYKNFINNLFFKYIFKNNIPYVPIVVHVRMIICYVKRNKMNKNLHSFTVVRRENVANRFS